MLKTSKVIFSLLSFSNFETLYPKIEAVHPISDLMRFYFKHETRCEPQKLLLWNPTRGEWKAEAQFQVNKNILFSVGHVSDHQINNKDIKNLNPAFGNESYNYFQIQYEVTL